MSDSFPSENQLKIIQAIENRLLERKRAGNITGIIGIVITISQILLAAVKEDYVTDLGHFFSSLVTFNFNQLIVRMSAKA